METVEILERLGASTLEVFWLPLAAWTAFWFVMEGVLFLNDRQHPTIRYRAYQALLISLPVGMLAAAATDLTSVLPAIPTVTFPFQLETVTVIAEGGGIEVVEAESATGFTISIAALFGAGSLGAAGAALYAFLRLLVHAAALLRLRRRLGGEESSQRETTTDIPSLPWRGAPRIIVSDLDVVPMTFGWFRPIIVLPSSLDERARAIALKHELVHIRQDDYMMQWVEALVTAAFAVHPAVHQVRHRCSLLREMSCDAALVADPHIDRRTYADLLFRFITPPARTHAIGVSMADSKPHLHQRLTAMKLYNDLPQSMPVRTAWLLALVVMLAGSAILTSTQVIAQRADVPAPPPPPAPPAPTEMLLMDGPDAPYVIVDGEPFEGNWDEIDPSRIRSIEVLKDERAIERFGERGRDGVIIITSGEAAEAPPAPPTPPSDTTTFVVVEEMPQIIGGLASVQQELRYPEAAKEAGVEGRVFIQFIVDERGRAVEPQVTKGVGSGLDEEAMRAVRTIRFKPGRHDGKPVRVRMSLPVTFKLGGAATGEASGSQSREALTIQTVDVRRDGDEGSITLRGSVVNPATGEPLAGANITATLEGRTIGAASTAEGKFVLQIDGVADPADLSPELKVTHPALDGPKAVRIGGKEDLSRAELPSKFAVTGTYPNPFSRATNIALDLPEAADVRVEVYDVAGRQVLTLPERSMAAGAGQTIEVDGSDLASGSYVYRVYARTAGGIQSKSGNLTVVK